MSDLNREHREASVEYVRSEQTLRIEHLKPDADRAGIQALISRRDAALKRLNSIRDAVLQQGKKMFVR